MPLSDKEWLDYLDSDQLAKGSLRQKGDSLHAAVAPLRAATSSKKLQRQLRWLRKKSATSSTPLLSGDSVIARNTRYVTRAGPQKFETKDGHVKHFTVQQVSQGFVAVVDDESGATCWKHESNLKAMPRALPPDDGYFPTPKAKMLCAPSPLKRKGFPTGLSFQCVAAKTDGACLFRALEMGLRALSGVAPAGLDRGGRPVLLEMDPLWQEEHQGHFSWDAYFEYLSKPHTWVHAQAFGTVRGVDLEVYSLDNGRRLRQKTAGALFR